MRGSRNRLEIDRFSIDFRRWQLQNPVNNIADSENVWSFDTLRPDGVARAENSVDIYIRGRFLEPRAKDTARSQGFFLYPYESGS